jgi:predicted PP-loop superfamily ATPase
MSDESIERKINNSLLRVQERHLERIKQLEQENAKLKERLKDAESLINLALIYGSVYNIKNSLSTVYEYKVDEKAREYFKKWGSDE